MLWFVVALALWRWFFDANERWSGLVAGRGEELPALDEVGTWLHGNPFRRPEFSHDEEEAPVEIWRRRMIRRLWLAAAWLVAGAAALVVLAVRAV